MVLLTTQVPGANEATEKSEFPALLTRSDSSELESNRSAPHKIKEAIEVRDISGKGKGIFATRKINCGEIIYREKPLIVMPQRIFDDDDPSYIELWLDRRINRMSSEERYLFYSLSDSRFFSDGDKTTLGIFYTNDMTFTDDSAALFPTLARVNHSCAPNADFVARDHLGVQDLVATKDIKIDEEVTICYLPSAEAGSDVREVRQEYTRTWYGFQCTCKVCLLEGPALDANEKVRVRVKSFQSEEFDQMSFQEIDDFVEALIQIEAKLPYLISILDKAISKALAENDLTRAAKYSTMAYSAAEIVFQVDDEQIINPYCAAVQGKYVTIGQQSYLFHL